MQGKRFDLVWANELRDMKRANTVQPLSLLELKRAQANYNPEMLHEALQEAHNLLVLTKKCMVAAFDAAKARIVLRAQADLLSQKLQLLNFKSQCPFGDNLNNHIDSLPHGNKHTGGPNEL